MLKLIPIAAAFAISASAAYAGPPVKVGVKDNGSVSKIGVKAPGTGSVKIMENPSKTQIKVQVPGTVKVQAKTPPLGL